MFTRVAVVAIILWSASVFGASEIAIDESRPLGKVVSRISHLYGYLVTYEEAPYDETTALSVDVYPNGTRFLYPSWRAIQFQLPQETSPVNRSGAPSMVQALVDQYNSSGNPGRFQVITDGEYTHVVPDGRVINGKSQDFEPVFDTVVSPSPQSALCGTVLNDLLSQIGKARGIDVVLGVVPMNPLMRYQCVLDGAHLTARQAFKQILEQMGRASGAYDGNRWTWNLCYEANWKVYFLNMELVPQGLYRQREQSGMPSR